MGHFAEMGWCSAYHMVSVPKLLVESESESRLVVSNSLQPHGQNTGVGSQSLLQGSSQSRD